MLHSFHTLPFLCCTFLWSNLLMLPFSCCTLFMCCTISCCIFTHCRSSRPEVFFGKGVLKICSKFTGKHPCRNAISRNFIEIALRHGCSPVNLLHIFRTSFLKNTSGWLLLSLQCFCFAFFFCCTPHMLQFFHVALCLCCIISRGVASTFLIIEKYWKLTKNRKQNQKMTLHSAAWIFVSLLFWYPITHFCHYRVLNGWLSENKPIYSSVGKEYVCEGLKFLKLRCE